MKKKKLMCSLSVILTIITLTSCRKPRVCNINNSTSSSSSQTTSNNSSNSSGSSSSSNSSTHTHEYGKWEVTKEPTLEDKGELVRKCVDNDDTEPFELPILNRVDYTYSNLSVSTCSKKGRDKYVYHKDGQDFDFYVDLDLDPNNHDGDGDDCYSYNGLIYGNFDNVNKTCSLIGYKIADESAANQLKNATVLKKITKDSVEYTVTTINERALLYCDILETITIPDSITSIKARAFSDCTSLKTITMPSSGVKEIANWAFEGCTSLEPITIPSTVETFGYAVFQKCTSLKSLTIPKSVTKIGYDGSSVGVLFYGNTPIETLIVEDGNTVYTSRNGLGEECNAIIDISMNKLIQGCKTTTIPGTVTSIGDSAFCWCESLESIVIPNSVETIGDYAFYQCASLETIDLPDSVTKIEDSVFGGCTALRSITIPKNVNKLGANLFRDCTSLESIAVDENNTYFTSRNSSGEECNVIMDLSKNVKYGFKNSTIPDNAKVISDGAFATQELEAITIPDSVTTIESRAFTDCTLLENVTISNSSALNAIGMFAFYKCTSLKSIFIPSGVTKIDSYAFQDCSSLESMVVDSANTTYDSRNDCNAIIKKADNTLVEGCKNTIIPGDVTIIGYYSFGGRTSLVSITIPSSVTTIDMGAFSNCSSLQSITIPSSVTTIDSEAFSKCTSLKYVVIPKNVSTISSAAFYDIKDNIDVFVDGSYDDGVSDALIEAFNDKLIYRSDSQPTDTTHSYWHYVDGNPVKW